jgi:hypothetical protein
MLALIALTTACGSASNEQTVTDSISVDSTLQVDTANVGSATTDSTAHIPVQ